MTNLENNLTVPTLDGHILIEPQLRKTPSGVIARLTFVRDDNPTSVLYDANISQVSGVMQSLRVRPDSGSRQTNNNEYTMDVTNNSVFTEINVRSSDKQLAINIKLTPDQVEEFKSSLSSIFN